MAIISGFGPTHHLSAVHRLNAPSASINLNLSGSSNAVGNFARQILADLFNIQGIGQGGLEGLRPGGGSDNGNSLNLVQSRIGGKGGDGGTVLNLLQSQGVGKDGGVSAVQLLNLNQARQGGK